MSTERRHDRWAAHQLGPAHRARLARLLRRLEREAFDRDRERRRRHEAVLRRWPALW
ncbi:MAG TPA: hypothetical protein VKD47_08815 [Miltoncostaeaceae bacterium]|nr:hypothetical protein [Miltoncostaeaceae bacterium]